MCEAASTCRASTWEIPPWLRSAAYKGLIAAPGRPNAWVIPSRSRIATAAAAAVMRAMSCAPCGSAGVVPPARLRAGRGAGLGRRPAGQLLDQLEEGGMVQPAVPLRVERPDELRDERAQRDRHAGLAGGRRDDAHVLVVQRDAEPGREVAGQHAGRLAVEDRVAGQAACEDLDGRLGVDAVGLEEDDRLCDELDGPAHDELVGRLDGLARAGRADVH